MSSLAVWLMQYVLLINIGLYWKKRKKNNNNHNNNMKEINIPVSKNNSSRLMSYKEKANHALKETRNKIKRKTQVRDSRQKWEGKREKGTDWEGHEKGQWKRSIYRKRANKWKQNFTARDENKERDVWQLNHS